MILNSSGKKIAVVGDMMFDRYLIGRVGRMSPEAPVPVVDMEREEIRFGGAANVCLNITGLGGTPIMLGVLGQDTMGNKFLAKCKEKHIESGYLIQDESRPTTMKTRVIGNQQHLVRIDKEVCLPISEKKEQELLSNFGKVSPTLSAVILQDYNKGVLTPTVIKGIMAMSCEKNIPVFVDPKHSNFFEYRNAFLFKPNLRELSDALMLSLYGMPSYKKALKELKKKNNAQNILLTLSGEGMLFLNEKNDFHHISTTVTKVADVSGAGDTVIATVTMAFVCGIPFLEAVVLANRAAGIVIKEPGIVPIRMEQL